MYTSSALLLVASLVGQPSGPPQSFREFAKTVTFYYTAPNPAFGPRMLKELLKKENLEHPFFANNDHLLNIHAVLLGDIAAGKPKIVRAYEAAFVEALPAGRRLVIGAPRHCGDQETVNRIDAWRPDRRFADVRADLDALKKHLEDPKRKQVRNLPAREPRDLDLLWANFFITGEYAPVAKILDVFDPPDAKDNETLKRVAKWSLGSNLQQHPKLVELVRKRLFIGRRIPARKGVRDNVVHVKRVGHGNEILAGNGHDKRLVAAWLVDVVQEAEFLQRFENVDGTPHPIGVPAHGSLTRHLVDHLDAVGDEAFFLISRQVIAVVPDAAVGSGFVAASHDLSRNIRRGLDGLADHEGAELDLMLMP